MPILTRESLATRLRQNWMAKHPADLPLGGNLDDSLTSLNWLQNLNIMKIATPTPPASPTPSGHPQSNQGSAENSGDLRVNPNHILNMTNMPLIKQEPGMAAAGNGGCGGGGFPNKPPPPTTITLPMMDLSPPCTPGGLTSLDRIDYKTNPHVKPPYSYATLICMAMRETKKSKITLSGIYNWITENFMYYRMADPSWQNSIRHNLSLNKCFQKVPRRKDEPGKGGFWRINPEFSDMFVNGIFKKRRNSTRENIAPPLKKIKKEMDDNGYDSEASCSGYDFIINGRDSKLKNDALLRETHNAVLCLQNTEEGHEAIKGHDFSWNAILNQDIDVGGIKIKTEAIIDDGNEQYNNIASPITALSPPPSDSSSEIDFNDIFNSDLSVDTQDSTSPDGTDFTSGSPLDLSISGVGLRPPGWWAESLNAGSAQLMFHEETNSGMNTPIHNHGFSETDFSHEFSHPWAESKEDIDEAIASFDVDIHNLFDVDNIPSPKIS